MRGEGKGHVAQLRMKIETLIFLKSALMVSLRSFFSSFFFLFFCFDYKPENHCYAVPHRHHIPKPLIYIYISCVGGTDTHTGNSGRNK